MPERRTDYGVTLATPAGIFTGLGVAGLVDRFTVRDGAGLPVLPGSSVKGRLRFHAERLLRSGGGPPSLSIHDPARPACKELAKACTICRLFGSGAIAGQLRVGNAALTEPWAGIFTQLLATERNPVVHGDVEVRPGVALSRLTRTARPHHLFFDEAVPAAVSFSGNLVVSGAVSADEQTFLLHAGAIVDALGARKAAGRGLLVDGIRIGERWQ